MCAERLILKKSSVSGKKPTANNLQFGEIAINYAADDPGLFFEDSTQKVRKIGPTNFSFSGPVAPYSLGELWYNQKDNTLQICEDDTALNVEQGFVPVRSLLPTGDSGFVLYVSPEDSTASDSLDNDGTIRPFVTLNRAILEVYRNTLGDEIFVDDAIDRYTILVLSGDGAVYNGPGEDPNTFSLNRETSVTVGEELTADQIESFNPTTGGLVIPKGASVIGVSSSKSILRPAYIPDYQVTVNYNTNEFSETADSKTEIIKVTGSSSIEGISIRDKKLRVEITSFEQETSTGFAIFNTNSPHGFVTGEQISVTRYSSNLITVFGSTVGNVEVVGATKFKLTVSGSVVTFSEAVGSDYNPESFGITIAEIQETKTHHLLSGFGVASQEELEQVYEKVRKFFTTVSNPILSFQVFPEEYTYTSDEEPSFRDININTSLGMSGFLIDGNKVEGTKSVTIRGLTYDGFQGKAIAYDAYATLGGVNGWQNTYLVYNLSFGIPASDEVVLNYLYTNFDSTEKRLKTRIDGGGRPTNLDCRHSAIRAEDEAIVQCFSSSITGTWPAFWARGGSRISSVGAEIQFGNAILSEGFSGLGTATGSNPDSQNYLMTGIVRPRLDLTQELIQEDFDTEAYINSFTSTQINLVNPLDLNKLSPYTLEVGDLITVVDDTGTPHTTALVSPAINPARNTLFINDVGFNPGPISTLTSISVQKKLESRSVEQWTTKVRVRNTDPLAKPPKVDQILRLAATGVGSNAVKSGVQLDPAFGGWNTVFIIAEVFPLQNLGEYDLVLILGDDSRPYKSTDPDFYQFQHSNLEGKTYITDQPTSDSPPTRWNFVKSFLPTQTVDESFQSDSAFDTISISNYGTYQGSLDILPRGVQWKWNPERLEPLYTGFSNVNEPSLKAVRRLLRVFGYTNAEITSLLVPQSEANRLIEFPDTGFIPSTTDEGFLQTNQYVPIEFNEPSTVISVGTYWFEPGFFISSQETQGSLSERESEDAIAVAIFGGDFVISGIRDNESQVLSDENTLIL